MIALWSAAAALAGLLFGFDVAVISGAEQTIQQHWHLTPEQHGLILSAALWGTVIGALGGAWPTDGIGRKGTLAGVAVGYVVASLGSALAPDPWTFATFRLIGGLAIGVSSIAAPAYISEIAPPERRGQLVGLYQFNIVAGILIAYFSNWVIGESGVANAWRLMLGVQVVPSLLFLAATIAIPESPMWVRKTAEATPPRAAWRDYLRAPLLRPAGLAFTIALFNQLSGINAVIYFAPRIFESAGLAQNSALLASIGIGLVNLLATGLAVLLIDRMGRRVLMLIGAVGYCLSLGTVAVAFATGTGGLVVPFVFLFIAAHAVGQGAVIWVFIAEVFPTHARARGQTIGCGTHWVLAALVTLALPPALAAFPPATIFGFFFAMMALQLVWVLRVMPETSGTTLAPNERPIAH
ncbi:MAG: MFS transporter [Novosphingobium sp.]